MLSKRAKAVLASGLGLVAMTATYLTAPWKAWKTAHNSPIATPYAQAICGLTKCTSWAQALNSTGSDIFALITCGFGEVVIVESRKLDHGAAAIFIIVKVFWRRLAKACVAACFGSLLQ